MFIVRRGEEAQPARARPTDSAADGALLRLQLTLSALFHTVFWPDGCHFASPRDDEDFGSLGSHHAKWARKWRMGKSVHKFGHHAPMLALTTALDIGIVPVPLPSPGLIFWDLFTRRLLAQRDPEAIRCDDSVACAPSDGDGDFDNLASRIVKWVRSRYTDQSFRKWGLRIAVFVQTTSIDFIPRLLAPDASLGPLVAVPFARRVSVSSDSPATSFDASADLERVVEVYRMDMCNGLRLKHACTQPQACPGCAKSHMATSAFAVHVARSKSDVASAAVVALFDLLKAIIEYDDGIAIDDDFLERAATMFTTFEYDVANTLEYLVRHGEVASSIKP